LPPLVVMSYLNPLLQFGLDKFMQRAVAVGVRGIIVPDIIVEEGRAVEHAARQVDIDLIYLMAPTSSAQRQAMILKRSRGFVYLVSVTGVTGARTTLPPGLNAWICAVRKRSSVPVAVGFGISGPAAARSVARVADGVIVGSAIIDMFHNGDRPAAQVERATSFLRSLQQAVRRPGATA
jgi:tryptophan synthase alpha chain